MRFKKLTIYMFLFFILLIGNFFNFNIQTLAVEKDKIETEEVRHDPPYEIVMGSDGWPHFRLCFWVPKDAKYFYPYADRNVNTDVSEHGPVEKWSVVESNITRDDNKLMYLYVPKTFVILKGPNFYKCIHLSYEIRD